MSTIAYKQPTLLLMSKYIIVNKTTCRKTIDLIIYFSVGQGCTLLHN